jgi:hypothetical protein
MRSASKAGVKMCRDTVLMIRLAIRWG